MVLRGRELRTQTANPQMEIEADFWEALPDELVSSILGRLPVRALARLRIVCKRWNSLLCPSDALQRIDPNFSVNSIPGFFIQFNGVPHDLKTWVIEVGQGGSDMNVYKAPLPNDQILVNACQSICCCHRLGDWWDISIGNPATRTWKRLPRPATTGTCRGFRNEGWDFIAMTFDPTSRRCTVLLGENNVAWFKKGRHGNPMVLKIYDSGSNAWTIFSMKAPTFIRPYGKGVYSKGNVYWIIEWNYIYFIVAFVIAEISWTEITLPEGCSKGFYSKGCYYPASLCLSGYDGQVVLIQKGKERGCKRMWRLNEGQGTAEWCEIHDICSPERNKFYSVVANSGWLMMVDWERQIYLCNPERKLTKKVSLPAWLGKSEIQFFSAFESNNVWWP